MRQEYVNFNPETIRAEKTKARKAEMQYMDDQLEKQKKGYLYSDEDTNPKKVLGMAISAGGVMGLIVGSCLCVGTGMMVETGHIPLTCFFCAPVIGVLIAYKKSYIGKGKKSQLDDGLRSVENQHEEAIRKIHAEIDRECKTFNEGFEREVCNKIAEFSQPPIDQLYIQKFANEFIDKINSQDRSSAVKEIKVTFTIKVYTDKVCTSLNEYPLMNILFKPLEGFAEEMAMARSVASAVQVEIMTLLQADLSGSQYGIELKESYEFDAAVMTMTYKADNNSFKEVQSW